MFNGIVIIREILVGQTPGPSSSGSLREDPRREPRLVIRHKPRALQISYPRNHTALNFLTDNFEWLDL
jgi:hypothetical protein